MTTNAAGEYRESHASVGGANTAGSQTQTQ
jgi:hypothetical protein